MAKQKIVGPYKVIDIGVGGHVWEVIEMINPNDYQELRPRYTTLSRQAAYGKCSRLNRRWQEQLNPDELGKG